MTLQQKSSNLSADDRSHSSEYVTQMNKWALYVVYLNGYLYPLVQMFVLSN